MAFNVSYIFQARDQFSGVADKVKRSMDGVRKKTKAVGRQLDTVGRKFVTNFKTKAGSALRSAKLRLDGLSVSAKKLSKNLRAVGAKFTAIATLPIALFTKSFITAASNAEETRSKFNTVFSGIRSQADMTADNLAKNFGLSGTKARELIGDTGDLLTGFGFTQEKALGLANEVNKLAVDLASFTNFSGGAEGASRALTKALLGERESIKSLGISILEEDVKARVKQLVLVDKMKFATERQAKAFATLQLAQQQSKNAIGDFNRTSESYANKVRIMEARTQDLRESFGNILLPIAVKVVEALTSLTQKFTNLAPVTKKIILVVAGLIAVVGPLLLLIAGIAAAVPFMITGLSAIGVAITGITGAVTFAIGSLSAIGAALTGLITGGVPFVVAGMSTIGAALAVVLSPIGLIVIAITALAFVVFKNFDAIKSFITDAIDFIVSKFNSLINIFKNSTIGKALIDAGSAIIDMWSSVFGFFGAVFSAIAFVVVSAFNAMSAAAMAAFSFIMEIFINPLISAFQFVANILLKILSPVVGFLEGVLSSVVSKIEAVLGTVANVARFIGSIFDTATDKVKGFSAAKVPPIPVVDLAAKRSAAESLLGVQGRAVSETVAANEELTASQSASATIDMNIRAPDGTVESVRTQRKGNPGAMDLGVNMVSAA